MRIATYQWNGRRHAGVVAEDVQSLAPLNLEPGQARTGALAVIELGGDLKQLSRRYGQPLRLRDVKLEAPLPEPRRNLFCVGRNYHAHTKELSMNPPQYLKSGDVVRIEIDGIGVIENRFV